MSLYYTLEPRLSGLAILLVHTNLLTHTNTVRQLIDRMLK